MNEENLPLLTVLVGLQCSGKSTKSAELMNDDTIILASDEYRKNNPDWNNDKVFNTLYNDMNNYLRKGLNVVIDATNLTLKSRLNTLRQLKVDCIKKCLIMNTSYDECIRRLKIRNEQPNVHHVPEEALKKYLHSFEIPGYFEGWDIIDINNKPTYKDSINCLRHINNVASTFNQNNMHHTQLLGEHMLNTYKNIKEKTSNNILIESAKYHDVGKLFTQTYKENDSNAHYYDHANVGAYYLLCNCGIYDTCEIVDEKKEEEYHYSTNSVLDWLFYINYHMKAFDWKTEKSMNKWKSMFGEEKFNNLILLNQSDKSRPKESCDD